MRLDKLATELRRIAKRGGGFGSDVESSLLAVADALDLQPELDEAGLKKLLRPKAKKAPSPASFETPPSKIVDEYVERLRSRSNSGEGMAVVAELLKDSRIRRAELYEIAGRFVGAKVSFKNRTSAEAAIKEKLSRKDWDQATLDMLRARTKL